MSRDFEADWSPVLPVSGQLYMSQARVLNCSVAISRTWNPTKHIATAKRPEPGQTPSSAYQAVSNARALPLRRLEGACMKVSRCLHEVSQASALSCTSFCDVLELKFCFVGRENRLANTGRET